LQNLASKLLTMEQFGQMRCKRLPQFWQNLASGKFS
jgi:hypothetical protein